MTAPTLLRTDPHVSIPYYVIEDLQLHKIFADSIIRVLLHPCDGNTVKLRQELFRRLDNDDFRENLASFHRDLRELSRLDVLYRKESGSAAKYLILSELQKRYIIVCRDIPSLRGCTLTDAIADYFCDEAHTAMLERMETSLSDADPHLSAFSRFDLSFHEKSWVTPDHDSISYIELIRDGAASLGFNVDRSMRMRSYPNGITLGHAVDSPLSSLFADDIMAAGSALVPYPELETDALTKLTAETAFCLEMHEFVTKLKSRIPVCFPRVSESRRYMARGAYDFTLTYKNVDRIVPNDIDFTPDGGEFSFLVGANGGGKTTYLRGVGANLILFLAGAPVFAEDAEIYPFRDVRTHFPADERMAKTGRLHDEVRRVSTMLDLAGEESFFLFNETYSGTDDKYGCELTADTADRMRKRSLFGIFVTHFHELQTMGAGYNFLEAVIDSENENERTYRIVKRRSGLGSYAFDILKKYGLDRESLERRE